MREKKLRKVAKHRTIECCGLEESDCTVPLGKEADMAIVYCRKVIQRVLAHYEPSTVIYSIISDFDKIILTDADRFIV